MLIPDKPDSSNDCPYDIDISTLMKPSFPCPHFFTLSHSLIPCVCKTPHSHTFAGTACRRPGTWKGNSISESLK